MRLAPAALFYAPAAAVHFAGETSRTTHGAREAGDTCRLQAPLLVRALGGADREALLADARAELEALAGEPLAPKIAALAEGAFRGKSEDELRGTGYVVDCLEAALACLERSTSYRDAVLRAANLGDDADTTAAVCGQLTGALYGASGIPEAWLERLAMRETIEDIAGELANGRPRD